MDDPIWDFTVFSKNRELLLEADAAREPCLFYAPARPEPRLADRQVEQKLALRVWLGGGGAN